MNNMEDVSEPTRDKQKEGYGRIATFLWIAFGIYLFAATPEAHFLSWQAAVFFVVGMFTAAVVFGGASYAAMGHCLGSGPASVLTRTDASWCTSSCFPSSWSASTWSCSWSRVGSSGGSLGCSWKVGRFGQWTGVIMPGGETLR